MFSNFPQLIAQTIDISKQIALAQFMLESPGSRTIIFFILGENHE
jgi:hypothetical protein